MSLNKIIIGEIPARYGSKRIPCKNLKLLAGKPLIQYAIEAAKKSLLLKDIYVNTDSDEIGKVAIQNGVKYYKRKKELAGDNTLSDEFNFDFIQNIKSDILVMINPVCPLINSEDIDNVINFFLKNNFDTVITVKEEKMQTFYKNTPVNININEKLKRSQDNIPVQICNWAVAIWNAETFIKEYKEKELAVFSGKLGFYPINKLKSVKISTESDFMLAEAILSYEKN